MQSNRIGLRAKLSTLQSKNWFESKTIDTAIKKSFIASKISVIKNVLMGIQKFGLQIQKFCLRIRKFCLRIELNLVGGTYAERCKTCPYWPVSIGVTAWQHPQLVTRGRFEVHDETERDSGAERIENQCAGMSSVIVIARMLCLNWCM